MSQLGYGVYQVEPDECERCVLDASPLALERRSGGGYSRKDMRGLLIP